MHIQPNLAQRIRNTGGGPVFGKTQFRMVMDIVAEFDQRCNQIGDVGDMAHGVTPRPTCPVPELWH